MSDLSNQLSDEIENLVGQYNLHYCVQCGKCVAVCPMGQIFDDFSHEVSPRGIIERTLLDYGIPDEDHLWFCLTCDLCTDMCPMGVTVRDFVEAVRSLVIKAGVREFGSFCRSCNDYLWPIHTVEYLQQVLGDLSQEYLTQCTRCRKNDVGEKFKGLRPGNQIKNINLSQVGGKS